MTYKIFLGLIISVCLITAMVFTNTDSSSENIKQPKELVLLKSRDNDNSLERTTKNQVIDKTNEPEIAANKVSKQQKPQKESLFGKVTPDEFSQQFVFTETNKEFVAKSALDKIFRMDTDALFEGMAEVEYSEEAQRRKDQLTYLLLNELEDTLLLEQKVECAGKVCAVELLFPSNSNIQSLDKISQFSSNYAFEQFTETEAGDKKLKALYIATPNPSQLTLAD